MPLLSTSGCMVIERTISPFKPTIMEPIYKLLLLIFFTSILTYFITLGIFNLVKTIVEKSKDGLKGIFILLCLVLSVYAITQRERAPELLDQMVFWEQNDGSKSIHYYTP